MHALSPVTTRTRSRRHALRGPLTLIAAGALVLSGCSADSSTSETTPENDAPAPAQTSASAPDNAVQEAVDDEPAGDEPTTQEPPNDPVYSQEESCGWDSPPLPGALPAIPTGQEGDLDAVIIGAWQHTHFDSGAGYEALDDKDIRYIFPSSDRMLYCQHVPGITEHAENAGDIGWEGTGLVLPNGSVGYTVTAWNDHVMVWDNHLDGSQYVLQRR